MNENMYGFLLIDAPEKKAKHSPIERGDEWKRIGTGQWEKEDESGFGEPFCSCHIHRRPLILPSDPEWQLVPIKKSDGTDEQLVDGDEGISEGREWWRINIPSDRQPITVSEYLQMIKRLDWNILAIRRRKQKPVSGWVSVKERLPEPEEYPCWVTDGKEIDEANRGYRYSGVLPAGFPMSVKGGNDWDGRITHFCPKPKQEPPPLPTPPAPEQSASEKAKRQAVDVCIAELRELTGGDYRTGFSAAIEKVWNAALNKGTQC